jgi:hypothetical protein
LSLALTKSSAYVAPNENCPSTTSQNPGLKNSASIPSFVSKRVPTYVELKITELTEYYSKVLI